MYNIVQEEISSVNGLGAGGENLQNFMPLINAGVNAATQIATTAITAKQQAKAAQNTYVGGNTVAPTVYTPPTVPPNYDNGGSTETNKKSFSDYAPWIIGACVVLVGGYMLLKK